MLLTRVSLLSRMDLRPCDHRQRPPCSADVRTFTHHLGGICSKKEWVINTVPVKESVCTYCRTGVSAGAGATTAGSDGVTTAATGVADVGVADA